MRLIAYYRVVGTVLMPPARWNDWSDDERIAVDQIVAAATLDAALDTALSHVARHKRCAVKLASWDDEVPPTAERIPEDQALRRMGAPELPLFGEDSHAN